MSQTKVFTVTRKMDDHIPHQTDVWIDGQKRRWRILEILDTEMFGTFRGMRMSVRFVAEAL